MEAGLQLRLNGEPRRPKCSALLELDAAIDSPVIEVGDGILAATFQDPDGDLFGVIQNLHFDVAKVG